MTSCSKGWTAGLSDYCAQTQKVGWVGSTTRTSGVLVGVVMTANRPPNDAQSGSFPPYDAGGVRKRFARLDSAVRAHRRCAGVVQ